ncbi:RNA polymerase sigma factor SigJ [Magnetovibrio sp.]|uniref:RNA polymerase sigma factor SigJ n=1 Tax=Magnetovibrio sp. TaxID=2024836 RepID=UPI002F944725
MTSHKQDRKTELFEHCRSRLRGVAYRMLGSVADAEDAVQDVYLKWRTAELSDIENPQAWLVTTCTRRCIDMLRAAHKTRVEYVGTWLPEPVVGDAPFDVGEQAELASSLTMAFLLLLERLNPVERAAYLLREVFGYAYKDVAFAVGRSEATCRQIVSRAKKRLEDQNVNAPENPQRREGLLDAFMDALRSGETQRLAKLLADDVELRGDGGGKVIATMNVIRTPQSVAKFLAGVWQKAWRNFTIETVTVNANPGAILRDGEHVYAILSLTLGRDGKCARIDIVRNPDKLRHIDSP